jgi:hypothetical protein
MTSPRVETQRENGDRAAGRIDPRRVRSRRAGPSATTWPFRARKALARAPQATPHALQGRLDDVHAQQAELSGSTRNEATSAPTAAELAAVPDDSTVVGVLAEKTPSGAVPNVYHRQLILGELFGQTIAMTGQAVIGAGDVKQAPDGTVGVHVDEFPEEAALLRWKNYDVLEIERAAARVWRAGLRAVT